MRARDQSRAICFHVFCLFDFPRVERRPWRRWQRRAINGTCEHFHRFCDAAVNECAFATIANRQTSGISTARSDSEAKVISFAWPNHRKMFSLNQRSAINARHANAHFSFPISFVIRQRTDDDDDRLGRCDQDGHSRIDGNHLMCSFLTSDGNAERSRAMRRRFGLLDRIENCM